MCDSTAQTGPTVSPLSMVHIRASQANPLVQPVIALLAAGATVDTTLAALGIAYTGYISFAATTTAAVLNELQISLVVAGEERQSFLGAELSAANANVCGINACGKGACVGGLEGLVVRVKNISAAPIVATESLTMRLQRYFPGDGPKYMCDGDTARVQQALPACERS